MIPVRLSPRFAPRLAAAAAAATILLGVSSAFAWVGEFSDVHVAGCVVTVTGSVLYESSGAYYLNAVAPAVSPQTKSQIVYTHKLAYTGSRTITVNDGDGKNDKDDTTYTVEDFNVTLSTADGLRAGGTYTFTITATDGSGNSTPVWNTPKKVTVQTCAVPPSHGGTDTPELGSGELLATGVLPLGLAFLVRRRRARRTARQ